MASRPSRPDSNGTVSGEAGAIHNTLVLPLDIDPTALHWPVENLEVVAVAADDLPFTYDFTRLAQALRRDGVALVVCCPYGPVLRFATEELVNVHT